MQAEARAVQARPHTCACVHASACCRAFDRRPWPGYALGQPTNLPTNLPTNSASVSQQDHQYPQRGISTVQQGISTVSGSTKGGRPGLTSRPGGKLSAGPATVSSSTFSAAGSATPSGRYLRVCRQVCRRVCTLQGTMVRRSWHAPVCTTACPALHRCILRGAMVCRSWHATVCWTAWPLLHVCTL